METYEALEKRHTVRDFENKEIPEKILRGIIKAGLLAPTNDHLRKWEFIIIKDQNLRIELVKEIRAPDTRSGALEIIDDWGLTNLNQREMYLDGIPKQHKMLLEAGALILPCFVPAGELLKPSSLSSLNPFASIWCCIENMLIAAADENIFGVTRIPFENERRFLKEKLNIPQEYEVACYLALGYPGKNSAYIKQENFDPDKKIHLNGWSNN